MVIIGILIALVAIVGIVSSRLITTFFHELGHAISALFFTKDKVVMYVGSYGDPKNRFQINLNRLQINISFNIWNLNIGMCAHKADTTFFQALIILLSGPLMSLIIGVSLFIMLTKTHFTDGEKFIIAIFMVSSFWDFIINIIPRSYPAKLYDGTLIFNDGKQFTRLLKKSILPNEYFEALSFCREGKYEDSKKLISELISKEKKNRFYQELLLDIYEAEKDYRGLIEAFDTYMIYYKPSKKYILKWADAKIAMHQYDEVINKLTNLIYHGKGNYDIHFKRGKALIELGEYKDALIDFNSLTLGAEEDPLALANRAYCEFRLGFIKEACEDIMDAIETIKEPNGEIYFFAGIIFETIDKKIALDYFRKAEELKYNHHGLAFNISQLER